MASDRKRQQHFWRLSIAPLTPILSGLIFTDKKEANRLAWDHNRIGEFRGRGVKAVKCDCNGNILLPSGEICKLR